MNTQIFKIDPASPDPEIMSYCGRVIREGGLVCFPTETVYGLGANALDAKAVENIFKAKGRPQDNPLIVHIGDLSMVRNIGSLKGDVRKRFKLLSERFWPGPLTMIVPRKNIIPDAVTCGLSTVGIRFPENIIARKLILESKVPIAAPSANLSGRPSPTCAEHCIEDMKGKVDVIIDGGPCKVGLESTVLDITGRPCILRPGFVTLEDLSSVLEDVTMANWKDPSPEKPRSPGMKYRHYAPSADMYLACGKTEDVIGYIKENAQDALSKGLRCGILCTDEEKDFFEEYFKNKNVIILSMGRMEDPASLGKNVFARLRDFDSMSADVILATGVSAEGVGNAVMNRLFRAAGGKVINVPVKR